MTRSAAVSRAGGGRAHAILDEPEQLPCTGGSSLACAGLLVSYARPAVADARLLARERLFPGLTDLRSRQRRRVKRPRAAHYTQLFEMCVMG